MNKPPYSTTIDFEQKSINKLDAQLDSREGVKETLKDSSANHSSKLNSIDIFFREIKRCNPLSDEQLNSLFDEIEKGREIIGMNKSKKPIYRFSPEANQALNLIIQHNIKLIITILGQNGIRPSRYPDDYLDYIQEVTLSARRSVELYNRGSGSKLSSFIYYGVISGINQYRRKNNFYSRHGVSLSIQRKLAKIKKFIKQKEECGQTASMEEIEAHLGLSNATNSITFTELMQALNIQTINVDLANSVGQKNADLIGGEDSRYDQLEFNNSANSVDHFIKLLRSKIKSKNPERDLEMFLIHVRLMKGEFKLKNSKELLIINEGDEISNVLITKIEGMPSTRERIRQLLERTLNMIKADDELKLTLKNIKLDNY